MQIADGKVVTIDYTLKDRDGNVIDSSEGGEGLTYLHGAGNIITGLEQALTGKSAGDSMNVAIDPESAYGERNDQLVQKVARDRFETGDAITVGMQFHTQTKQGQPMVVTVIEVNDKDITVDANHPLAGEELHFDVKVTEVRDATEEEISHGHVHGPGGHHHHD